LKIRGQNSQIRNAVRAAGVQKFCFHLSGPRRKSAVIRREPQQISPRKFRHVERWHITCINHLSRLGDGYVLLGGGVHEKLAGTRFVSARLWNYGMRRRRRRRFTRSGGTPGNESAADQSASNQSASNQSASDQSASDESTAGEQRRADGG
jgi:hypothetical protein